MTRTICILFSMFFVISCHEHIPQEQEVSSGKLNAHNPAVEIAPSKQEVAPEDVPREALSWDADLYLVNFNRSQEEKVRRAVQLIKQVVRTKEFKDRILSYQYKGKNAFIDNHGMTNEQIYQTILEGAEKMGNKSKNNAMDVELELYHQKTNTIGYTYPNSVRIWMNKKYFNRYTPVKVADNLMHEWMHKLGFTHAVKWSKDRDHSVPYAVGYLVEELAEKIAE